MIRRETKDSFFKKFSSNPKGTIKSLSTKVKVLGVLSVIVLIAGIGTYIFVKPPSVRKVLTNVTTKGNVYPTKIDVSFEEKYKGTKSKITLEDTRDKDTDRLKIKSGSKIKEGYIENYDRNVLFYQKDKTWGVNVYEPISAENDPDTKFEEIDPNSDSNEIITNKNIKNVKCLKKDFNHYVISCDLPYDSIKAIIGNVFETNTKLLKSKTENFYRKNGKNIYLTMNLFTDRKGNINKIEVVNNKDSFKHINKKTNKIIPSFFKFSMKFKSYDDIDVFVPVSISKKGLNNVLYTTDKDFTKQNSNEESITVEDNKKDPNVSETDNTEETEETDETNETESSDTETNNPATETEGE